MTMVEIEARLPSGFHDAELLTLAIDYARSEAKIDFRLWSASEDESEAKDAASLHLESLQYLVIEPPKPDGYNKNDEHNQSAVSSYVSAEHPFIAAGLPVLQPGKFAHSLFVVNWNSSIHFAAASVRLEPATLLEPESSADAV